MTGWEIKDLLGMLKKAQEGDIRELNHMTASYTSECTVNKEYSTMVIKQQFEVENKDGERCILNSEPIKNEETETSADTQWGLTILQLNTLGSSVKSYCIPNNAKKSRIRLIDNNILEILSGEKTVTTHISEIERKLKPIYGIATEDEIQEAFDTLSCQQYVITSLIEVVYHSLESKTLGILEFEDDEYVSIINIENNPVRIIIYLDTADNLLKTIEHADKLMSEKFYEKVLRGMYPSMLELKNEYWLEESEEGVETITPDEFKERITITEITFNSDNTVTVTCDADEMFGEQNILINTDAKGNYKASSLAD